MKFTLSMLFFSFSAFLSAQYKIVPDSTFGTNGIIFLDDQPQIHDDWLPKIKQDSHGNIYMVGEFYLYKIQPNGKLDLTFGTDGYVWLQNKVWGTELIIDKYDNVVVGGYSPSLGYKTSMIKFDHKGSVDSSFGQDGIYLPIDGGYVYDMTLLDNNILFSFAQSPNYSFAVKSISITNAVLDSNFGINGTLKTDFPNYLYNHVLIEDEDTNFIYMSISIDSLLFLKYSKYGVLISKTKNSHSITNQNIYNLGVFTFTKIDAGYLLGNGIWGLDLIKVTESGEVENNYGNKGINTITKKYTGYFCDSKKLNSNINVLAIAAFKDSLANPALILLKNNGELISSVGDSGIYSILNIVSKGRYEASTISVINDSTFLIGGYYQSKSNVYQYNHERYFIAKYFVKNAYLLVEPNPIIDSFVLENIYPNPFNPAAHLKIKMKTSELLTIKVFDVLGQLVLEWNEFVNEGERNIHINLSKYSSGLYIVSVSNKQKTQSIKINLIK